MIVLSLELEIKLNEVDSLKEKRNILTSMIQKIKRRFNVSVIESQYQDDISWALLSMVCVSLSQKQAHQQMDAIIQFIEAGYNVEIINIFRDIR